MGPGHETGDDALLAALQRLHQELDDKRRAEFHRSLPLPELVTDRWERAHRLGWGPDSSVYDSAIVLGDVAVGAHTWVGPHVVLDGSGGQLSIGAWCSIAAGTHVYTHDTVAWALTAGAAPRRVGPVTIGERCYIGPQTVIAAGVTIEAGSVVAANSFVNAPVAGGTIVGGNPARPLGSVVVDGEHVELRFDHD